MDVKYKVIYMEYNIFWEGLFYVFKIILIKVKMIIGVDYFKWVFRGWVGIWEFYICYSF